MMRRHIRSAGERRAEAMASGQPSKRNPGRQRGAGQGPKQGQAVKQGMAMEKNGAKGGCQSDNRDAFGYQSRRRHLRRLADVADGPGRGQRGRPAGPGALRDRGGRRHGVPHPVHVGDEVSVYADLISTGRTSMKFQVEAWRRLPRRR